MSMILITGASGKLGQQITKAMLLMGHSVIVTSKREEALDQLEQLCGEHQNRLLRIKCNLISEGGQHLVMQIKALGLRPEVIINNAVDLSNQRLPLGGQPTKQQWKTEFELAVVAPYEIVMGIAGSTNSKLSCVVNISSMYGVVARTPRLYEDPIMESPIHYGVAKAAMTHLTKELAVRLAPKIRVNTISFGGVQGRVGEAFLKRYASLCPMGRMLKDHEVCGAIEFLISEKASMITGHNLVVDGGWTTW